MKIRRYLASNAQEAMVKVKMDLGDEAVILNTKKVKKKGIMGLFAKPMVEVLAAIDELQAPTRPKIQEQRQTPQVQTQKIETSRKEPDYKLDTLETRVSGMEVLLGKIYTQISSNDKNALKVTQQSEINTKPPVLDIFYENMIKNEVEPSLARKTIDAVAAKIEGTNGLNEAASVLSNMISSTFGKPETIKIKGTDGPTVVAFVGPTGVGKTTTLAKIAADFTLNARKTVGLITADTYRIAAVEQLKTYAEILGIPVTVVYDPSEMKTAIAKYSDKDIVLIDTAGRSHKNKVQLGELKEMLEISTPDEIYLVLSAASSYKSCCEIIENYEFIPNYKLIFTKTDEATACGLILNIKALSNKCLSYITTGQNVPDDIETINVDKLAKNLIGKIA